MQDSRIYKREDDDSIMSIDLHSYSLERLVIHSLESLGFVTLHPALVIKNPLADSRLSFVLKDLKLDNNDKPGFIGVIIRDWKRIVGIGQIHKAEELLNACPELTKIIIISSMGFSYSATRFAEKIGIGLISRGELISLYINRVEIF